MLISSLLFVLGVFALYAASNLFRSIAVTANGMQRLQIISDPINSATSKFLRNLYLYLLVSVGIVFLLLWAAFQFSTAIAFIVGALCSMLTAFLGIRASISGNMRTALAASESEQTEAFLVAMNSAVVTGLCIASLGLVGISLLFFWYHTPLVVSCMVGFALGTSLVTLFSQVAGGIFTTAIDLACDIFPATGGDNPQDYSRNPEVIFKTSLRQIAALNAKSSDVFDSYACAIISCVIIAANMTIPDLDHRYWYMAAPLVLSGLGLIASLIGIRAMDYLKEADVNFVFRSASILSVLIFLALSFVYMILFPFKFWYWCAVLLGVGTGLVIGLIPDFVLAKDSEVGEKDAALNLLMNLRRVSSRLLTCVAPILVIGIALLLANWCGGFYAISISVVAMLATVAISMGAYGYSTVARNASEIAEVAHLGADSRNIGQRLVSLANKLDTGGNLVFISAAALTGISLYAAIFESAHITPDRIESGIMSTRFIVGAFFGICLPCVFLSIFAGAVSSTTSKLFEEYKRQSPGLADGAEGALLEIDSCVTSSLPSALLSLRVLGSLLILSPLFMGYVFGFEALIGFLLATLLISLLFGLILTVPFACQKGCETGGVQLSENAKIVNILGLGSQEMAGQALKTLIKATALVALLIAPLI